MHFVTCGTHTCAHGHIRVQLSAHYARLTPKESPRPAARPCRHYQAQVLPYNAYCMWWPLPHQLSNWWLSRESGTRSMRSLEKVKKHMWRNKYHATRNTTIYHITRIWRSEGKQFRTWGYPCQSRLVFLAHTPSGQLPYPRPAFACYCKLCVAWAWVMGDLKDIKTLNANVCCLYIR